MKKIILAAMLSAATIPAAYAQTATTPGATTTTPSATGTMAPADGAMGSSSATGTMAPAGGAMDSTAAATPATPSTDGPFVTVAETGIQRVSDLRGEDVYSSNGEDIGEVSDILIGPDGRVAAVVVGVGGFLGIGQKDVAVSFDALTLPADLDAQTPAATTADTAGSAGTMATDTTTAATGAAGTATPAPSAEEMATRIVLDVSREQLEQAPAYEGNAQQAAQ